MSIKSAYEIGHIKGLRAASEKIAADLGVSADAVFRDVCERLMGTQGKTAADDRFFTGADAAIAGGGAAAGLGGVAAEALGQRGLRARELEGVYNAASEALAPELSKQKELYTQNLVASKDIHKNEKAYKALESKIQELNQQRRGLKGDEMIKAKKTLRQLETELKALAKQNKGQRSAMESVGRQLDHHFNNAYLPAHNAYEEAQRAYKPHQNSLASKLNRIGLSPERLKTLGTIGKITGGALGLGLLGKKTYDVATS